MAHEGLVFAPLGGAGEIGMNMYAYGVGAERARRWIVVDMGIGFGDMDSSPGVELLAADPAWLEERRDRIEGIFITHAHEDHVGAVARFYDRFEAPIFCTAFTAEIARRKMQEEGHSPKTVTRVDFDAPVEAGPFSVRFLPMTHSIPEAACLVIEAGGGRVVHTGDFKFDADPGLGPASDLTRLKEIAELGVDALVCDSTNVFAPGASRSEATIREPLKRLIEEAKGAVAATTFASNVARLKTLAEAGVAAGRSIVVAGRAMRRMIDAAVTTGVLTDFPPTISDDQARDIPKNNLLYLITGSQGEGRAALARIASGSHPVVKFGEGDTVIFSSKTIPGNERGVYRIYNMLSERGVKVIDDDMELTHVSGHARREDLRVLYEAVRPAIAVPMHGEHRHLVEHAAAARGWGAPAALVVPNGSLATLDPKAPSVRPEFEAGRLYLDGDVWIGAMDGVVRERLKMARGGHLVIALTMDEDDGELIADPEVRLIGGPQESADWPAPLPGLIGEAVDLAIEKAKRKELMKPGGAEELASRAARKICLDHWGKKPVTTVIVTWLGEEE